MTGRNSIIMVGTSGYSYPEWITAGFYPQGTPSGEMMSVYTKVFSTTELNYTWYQMPRADSVERQRKMAPPGFLFAAKLTRTLTHEVDPRLWPAQATAFRDGISPLQQSGQLAAVLVQLPPSFHRTIKNRTYLAALLDQLQGLPIAVEFRNDSWAVSRVFDDLARRNVTLVAVDEPRLPGLFPALDVVTSPDLFYVRFHGRNNKGWGAGSMNMQFDYDYTDDELMEWVAGPLEKMAGQARMGILYFNNHVRGQAPRNAARLIELLRERGLDCHTCREAMSPPPPEQQQYRE